MYVSVCQPWYFQSYFFRKWGELHSLWLNTTTVLYKNMTIYTNIHPHRNREGGRKRQRGAEHREILQKRVMKHWYLFLHVLHLKYLKPDQQINLIEKIANVRIDVFFTLLWVAKNRGGFGFSGGDCLSQVQKECAGGRIVWVGAWVEGGATNLGCSDEFVWSPAVCLPVTPKIH